jgi:hypothetical protein
MMRTSLGAWPDGIGDFVNHQILEDYVAALSRSNGVDLVTHYNTRVEDVKKVDESWILQTSSLTKVGATSRRRLLSKYWVRST